MQLGELFFNLGFKSSGISEAKNFESTIASTSSMTDSLNESLVKMQTILQAIAVKMGAVSKLEENEIKTTGETEKSVKKTNAIEEKSIKSTKQKGESFTILNRKLNDYWGILKKVTLAMIAAAGADAFFVKKMGEEAQSLDKLSKLSGLSKDSLQRMADTAAQTGTSIDEVVGTIMALEKASIDIGLGRGGEVGIYQFLGLNPHEDPVKMLDQLEEKLSTMPRKAAVALLKDLGLTENMIYYLMKRKSTIPISPGTIVSDQELSKLEKVNMQFISLKMSMERLMMKLGAALSPLISEFINFIKSHEGDILNFFKKWIPWVLENIPKMITKIKELGEAFKPFGTMIIAAGKSLGFMLDKYSNLLDVIFGSDNEGISSKVDSKNISPSPGASIMDGLMNTLGIQKVNETANKSPNPTTNNNNLNINIDGAKSPKATGEAVQKAVWDAFFQRVPSER